MIDAQIDTPGMYHKRPKLVNTLVCGKAFYFSRDPIFLFYGPKNLDGIWQQPPVNTSLR